MVSGIAQRFRPGALLTLALLFPSAGPCHAWSNDTPTPPSSSQPDDIWGAFILPEMALLNPGISDHHRRFMSFAGHGGPPDSAELAVAVQGARVEDIALAGRACIRRTWFGLRLSDAAYYNDMRLKERLEIRNQDTTLAVFSDGRGERAIAGEAWLAPVVSMPIRGVCVWGSYRGEGAHATATYYAENSGQEPTEITEQAPGCWTLNWGGRGALLAAKRHRLLVTMEGFIHKDTTRDSRERRYGSGDTQWDSEEIDRTMRMTTGYAAELGWLPKLAGLRVLSMALGFRSMKRERFVTDIDHIDLRKDLEDQAVEDVRSPCAYIRASYAMRRQAGIAWLYLGESLSGRWEGWRDLVAGMESKRWEASVEVNLLLELRMRRLSLYTGLKAGAHIAHALAPEPMPELHADYPVTDLETDLRTTPLAFDWRLAPSARLLFIPQLTGAGAFLWQMELHWLFPVSPTRSSSRSTSLRR